MILCSLFISSLDKTIVHIKSKLGFRILYNLDNSKGHITKQKLEKGQSYCLKRRTCKKFLDLENRFISLLDSTKNSMHF